MMTPDCFVTALRKAKPGKTKLYNQYKELVDTADYEEAQRKKAEKAAQAKAQEDLNALLGKKKKTSPSQPKTGNRKRKKRNYAEFSDSD